MSDLNWCTYCDNAVSQHSSSLYCSEECLREDALNNHPLLGYKYHEFKHFPLLKITQQQKQQQQRQSQTMDVNSHNDSNTDNDEEEDDDDNHNTQMKIKMESNRKPADDHVFRLETVLSDSHHQQKQSTNYHYLSYDDHSNHSLL